MADFAVSEELRSYFHAFWDNFPSSVMLLHRDRTILDRNPQAAAGGCVIGGKCSDRGERKMHRGCLANQALKEQTAKTSVQYIEQVDMVMAAYWIPIAGHPEVYVHFGVDITSHADPALRRRAPVRQDAKCDSCSGDQPR